MARKSDARVITHARERLRFLERTKMQNIDKREIELKNHLVVCQLDRHRHVRRDSGYYRTVLGRHWYRHIISGNCQYCQAVEHFVKCTTNPCPECDAYWNNGLTNIINHIIECPDRHCEICTSFLWPSLHERCNRRSCIDCIEYHEYDGLFCDVCFRLQPWGQGKRCHFECTECMGYCQCSEQCRICGHYICTDGLEDIICPRCEQLELVC